MNTFYKPSSNSIIASCEECGTEITCPLTPEESTYVDEIDLFEYLRDEGHVMDNVVLCPRCQDYLEIQLQLDHDEYLLAIKESLK